MKDKGPFRKQGMLVAAFVLGACSGGTGSDMAVGVAGGPVKGAVDNHCSPNGGDGGMIIQKVNRASCMPDMAGPAPDGGGDGGSTYGPTMYNAEGDDDDCKYHVKWAVSPTLVASGANVTLSVSVTYRQDGTPVAGANTVLEASLGNTHPLPNNNTATTEGPAGTYAIALVKFDASGRWLARFHFFEDCADIADSPHGHAAFYFDVP